MVPAESVEADEWPTRKPRAEKRFKAAQDAVLGGAGGEVVRAVFPALRKKAGLAVAAGKGVAGVAEGAIGELRRIASTPGAPSAALKALRELASSPVGKAGAAILFGEIGLAAAVGTLTYLLAAKILALPAERRALKSAKAAAAADAFRVSHVELAKKLGRPLTIPEVKALSTAFRGELAKLGLSTTDLSGLQG